MGRVLSWVLMIYCYARNQGIAQISAEKLLFAVIVINRVPQLVKVQRKRDFRVFNSIWDICIPHPFLPRLMGNCGKMHRKAIRARDSRLLQWNRVFGHIRAGSCTSELTALVTHTRPAQAQARQNPKGKWAQSPTSRQKAICNWLTARRGNLFSSVEWYWVYQPYAREGSMLRKR